MGRAPECESISIRWTPYSRHLSDCTSSAVLLIVFLTAIFTYASGVHSRPFLSINAGIPRSLKSLIHFLTACCRDSAPSTAALVCLFNTSIKLCLPSISLASEAIFCTIRLNASLALYSIVVLHKFKVSLACFLKPETVFCIDLLFPYSGAPRARPSRTRLCIAGSTSFAARSAVSISNLSMAELDNPVLSAMILIFSRLRFPISASFFMSHTSESMG